MKVDTVVIMVIVRPAFFSHGARVLVQSQAIKRWPNQKDNFKERLLLKRK